jgi:hypothetical protein
MHKKDSKKNPKKAINISPKTYITGGCLLGVVALFVGNSALSGERATSMFSFTQGDHRREPPFDSLVAKSEEGDEKARLSNSKQHGDHTAYREPGNNMVTVEVDYLLWRTREDGLAYATASDSLNQVHLKEHIPTWGSGFRLRAEHGGLFSDVWDVGFDWTSYNHHNNRSLYSSSNSLTPINLMGMFNLSNSLNAAAVHSDFHLRFNMMSGVIGKRIAFSKYLVVHPHAGLKGGWINQRQAVRYRSSSTTTFGILSGAQFKKINNFAGVGPELGIDLRWRFGQQFGIFGTMNTALLCGHFDVKTRGTLANSDGTTQISTYIASKNRIRPALQLMFGADWERRFGGMDFGVGAGYEVQYWWNQQQAFVNSFSSPPSYGGDLTMHGLTLRVKLGF